MVRSTIIRYLRWWRRTPPGLSWASPRKPRFTRMIVRLLSSTSFRPSRAIWSRPTSRKLKRSSAVWSPSRGIRTLISCPSPPWSLGTQETWPCRRSYIKAWWLSRDCLCFRRCLVEAKWSQCKTKSHICNLNLTLKNSQPNSNNSNFHKMGQAFMLLYLRINLRLT